jgi:hypothetical protein
VDKKLIKEHLLKTFCYRCGSSLDGANIVPISEMPVAVTAHVTCPNCKAESMITITLGGSGVLPVTTDLMPEEIKEFIGKQPISSDDLLDLHTVLKKGKLWNLMQQKEQYSVKKAKTSEEKGKSQE